jgi:hypothetical protein
VCGAGDSPSNDTIAWARVAEFGPRTASSDLDASLRLAAQEDHEIRAVAGLRAQGLVRDDQGRSRRHASDTIQCFLRNDDPVERALRSSLSGSVSIGSTSRPWPPRARSGG